MSEWLEEATFTLKESGYVVAEAFSDIASASATSITFTTTGENVVKTVYVKNTSTKVVYEVELTYTLGTPSVSVTSSATGDTTYGTQVVLTAAPSTDTSGASYAYTWFKVVDTVKTEVSGETGNTLVLTDVADSGTYEVQVKATVGSTPATTSAAVTSNECTASITAATLTVNTVTVDGKTYDGTTATTNGAITLSGAQYSETPTATATITWSSADAGANTVDLASIALEATTTNAVNANYKLGETSKNSVSVSTTIAKKDITLTAKAQIVTYGTAITNTVAKVKDTNTALVSSDEITEITLTQNSVNVVPVGSEELTITPSAAKIEDGSGNDVTANYNITYANGTLKINAKSVAITWAGTAEKTYTGTAQTAPTASFTGAYEEGTIAASVAIETGKTFKDVASYTFTATTTNTNYTLTNATTTVKIAAATLSVDYVTADSKTYDGTTTVTNGTVVLKGAVNNETPTATGTFEWTASTSGTKTVNVTAIALTDDSEGADVNKNYVLAATTASSVEPKDNENLATTATIASIIDAAFSNIVETGYTGTYDGTAHGASVTATAVNSQTITIEYADVTDGTGDGVYSETAPTFTNVGTYTVAYSITAANHTEATGTLTVTIKQQDITLTAKAQIVTYGTAITNTVAKVKDTNTALVSSDEITEITLTQNSVNVVPVGSEELTITPSAAKIEDGSGNDVTANYKITYADGRLSIKEKEVTLEWAGYSDLVYDGTEHTVSVEVTNAESGDSFTYTYTDNAKTDADTYTAEVTDLGNTNYALPTDDTVKQEFTIAQRVAEFVWTAPENLVYSGTKKVVTAAVSNLVDGDEITLTYNAASSKTDAGDYTAKVTALSNDNYVLSSTPRDNQYSWTITKAPVTFTFTLPDDALIYNAAEQNAALDVTATWSDGVTEEIVYTDGYTLQYDMVDGNTDVTPIDAGAYEVTATLSSDNYYIAGEAESVNAITFADTHDIAPKEISASWLDTTQTYTGSELLPTIVFYGVETSDVDKVNNIAGKTDAGSYTLTLELNDANYTVSAATASHSFIIQKQEVVFALAADGSGSVTATLGTQTLVEDTDYTVSYIAADGTVYDAIADLPTTTATYTVQVSLTDSANYRVAGFDSSTASIGSYKVNGTIQSYTASFEAEGVAVDALACTTLAGAVFILPDGVASSDTDYVFVGWKYSGKTYQAGDAFTQPSNNITFTAVYEEVHDIDVTVTDFNGTPLPNTVVSIMLGSEVIVQDITDENGAVSFSGITADVYNVVCTYDGTTKTAKADITSTNADLTVVMPEGRTSSLVEVTDGSPAIVVGGLDEAFATDDTDEEVLDAGGAVELKLTVDDTTSAPDAEDAAKIEAAASNVALYLDITLTKTVTDMYGNIIGDTTTLTAVENEDGLLEIIIPLPTSLQGKSSYSIYRVHDGALQQLTTSANDDGEYYEVNAAKTVITLHVRNFSTYAIAYKNASTTTTTTTTTEEEEVEEETTDEEIEDEDVTDDTADATTGTDDTNTETDDTADGAGDEEPTTEAGGEAEDGGRCCWLWWLLILVILIIIFIVWKRKKKEEDEEEDEAA